MTNKLILGVGALAVLGGLGFAATQFGGPEAAPKSVADLSQVNVAQTAQPVADGAAMTAADLAPAGVFPGLTTETGGFTGDVATGAEDAPVTIVEYASLTCPHCATFHKTTYQELKEAYVDTGKARFIYRDYPLNQAALFATMIARCGGEDRYLGFIDLFLRQQSSWGTSEDVVGALKAAAKVGGLDEDTIDACLKDVELGQSVIDRARASQSRFNVTSTPSLVIDGELYKGRLEIKAISSAIDSKL